MFCYSVQSEVKFRGGFSHPNLVKLLGYCLEDKEQDLYEMVAKLSFENRPFLSKLCRMSFICYYASEQ